MSGSDRPKNWLQAHRELGLNRACGFGLMAQFLNHRVVSIWLSKRIALTDDPVARDHLERSLRWLEKAQAAEQEGLRQRTGGTTTTATPAPRGGRIF